MGATTHSSLREQWRELRCSRPGRRFQDRYERARQQEHKGLLVHRIALIAVAILALVIAGFLAVFPGPAIPFFFVAGGLLASESRTVARFMDWCEVKLRAVLAWGKRQWRRLPGAGRVVLATLFVCGSAAAAFVGFHILRR